MSKFSVKKAALLALLLYGLSSVLLFAQGDRGAMNGRVTDKNGAAVPNAKVLIIEEESKVTLETKSNSSGEYAFPSLTPGKYSVKVSVTGFSSYDMQHVQVDLGPQTRIDIPLEVGSVDTTVTVNGELQLLSYDSADLGLVVEEKALTDLPLIYGNAFSLENLTPGLVLSSVSPNVHVYDSGTSNVSINGSMFNSIDYKLDGAADNRIRTTAFTPNTESISQYRLSTSSYDTSQGHASGGFTNVQAKSGTDKIHGSVYSYYQNPNINSNAWMLNPTTDQVKPKFLREGFSFGTPLLRQKLFFFIGFEHSNQTNPSNGLAYVPTQAQIAGDFSAMYALDTSSTASNVCGSTAHSISGTANVGQLYDPRTSDGSLYRKCIPNNNIAAYGGGIDPVAANILKYYPKATGTSGALGTYYYSEGSSDLYSGGIARFDYKLNDQQQMYMHLVRSERYSKAAQVFKPMSANYLKYNNYSLAVGHTIAISSSTVLSTVLGYTRFTDNSYNPSEYKITPVTLGMPTYLVSNQPHSAYAIPRFDISQYTSLNTTSDYQHADDVWLGSTTLSKQLRSHLVKLGGEYRLYKIAGQSGQYENGSYASSGVDMIQYYGATAPSIGYAGFSLAQLEMGILTSGSQVQTSDYLTNSHYFSLFLQDDWRINKRLTANIGIRWEYESPMRESNGKEIAAFDFNATNNTTASATSIYASNGLSQLSSLLPSTLNATGGAIYAKTKGYGLSPYSSPKNQFSPRLGLNFSVTPHLVLRAGYGIFFDSLMLYYMSGVNSGSTTVVTVPQQGYSASSSIVAPTYAANSVTISSTLDNPFPDGLTKVTGNTLGVNTALGQNIQFLTPHPHTPYNERWNVGLQQQMGQFVMSLSYVGNRGVHTPTAQSSSSTNTGGQDFNAIPTNLLSTEQNGLDQNQKSIFSTTISNPFSGLVPSTNSGCSNGGSTIAISQMLRPRPEFCTIDAYTYGGRANYHSLQAQVQRRFNGGLSTTQSFTWSKAMDGTTYLNAGDTKAWYGISSTDRPLRYSMSVIYQLPWGHKRKWMATSHSILSQVVGGWQVQGVYQIQSGAPLNFNNVIYYGSDPSNAAWSRSKYKSTQRAATSSSVAVGGFWFNPNDWLISSSVPLPPGQSAWAHPIQSSSKTVPVAGCPYYVAGDKSTYLCSTQEPGTAQLRTFPIRFSHLRADHLNQADISFQRQFQVRKFGTLQFRGEAVNVLNHPVYSAPSTDPTSSTFGQITTQANQSRVYQFAGFFRF